MPRLKNAVPKYRRHKVSGQAVVTFAGVDHYLGTYGSQDSRDEYDRLIAEYLACGRDASRMNCGQEYSIAQLLRAFKGHAEGYYVKNGRPTSELVAFRQVGQLMRRLYGRQPVDSFGPLALKALREHWLESGVVRTTINQNQGRVVRIFKWGVGEELVKADTWRALTAVDGLRKGRSEAPESRPIQPVGLETIQATLPHLSPIVQDMIRMQLLTGMRPGEVCMLRPGDIDRSEDVWEYRPDGHKTEHHDRDRVIYIGPQAAAILAPYLFRDPESHCFSAAESKEWFRAERERKRVTPASCGNARGRRGKRSAVAKSRKPAARSPRTYFDTSSYGQAITYACRKAWPAPAEIAEDPAAVKAWEKTHRWAPNQIRHTRGTEIRKQFGLEAAQVILGHASADITQIYAERDAEKARDVIRQIG